MYGEHYFSERQQRRSGIILSFRLALDVWQQRHEPSSLDRSCEITLPFCGHTRASAVEHSRVRVRIRLELQDVLVVNVIIDRLSLLFV